MFGGGVDITRVLLAADTFTVNVPRQILSVTLVPGTRYRLLGGQTDIPSKILLHTVLDAKYYTLWVRCQPDNFTTYLSCV